MELLVLRHGKSSWSNPELEDFDRPLNSRGTKDAQRMGKFLLEQNLLPQLVLASDAERARTTTQLCLAAAGEATNHVAFLSDLYHAGPGAWLTQLRKMPDTCTRIMIVGHNPGLEDLLEQLCGPLERDDDGKFLTTAALAHVRITGAWSALTSGKGRLLNLQRPRNLTGAP